MRMCILCGESFRSEKETYGHHRDCPNIDELIQTVPRNKTLVFQVQLSAAGILGTTEARKA